MEKFNVSTIIPSTQNIARLLREINTNDTRPLCIMCEMSRATMATKTLCSDCWAECEGQNDDQ